MEAAGSSLVSFVNLFSAFSWNPLSQYQHWTVLKCLSGLCVWLLCDFASFLFVCVCAYFRKHLVAASVHFLLLSILVKVQPKVQDNLPIFRDQYAGCLCNSGSIKLRAFVCVCVSFFIPMCGCESRFELCQQPGGLAHFPPLGVRVELGKCTNGSERKSCVLLFTGPGCVLTLL